MQKNSFCKRGNLDWGSSTQRNGTMVPGKAETSGNWEVPDVDLWNRPLNLED